MQFFRPGVGRMRLILALLAVLTLGTGFLFQPQPVQAEIFHLAPPAQPLRDSQLFDRLASPQAQADSSILHLPIVLTPPGVQLPNSRQAALDLYRQEYLSYTQTPIEWTGDHPACDPGTTSPAYRQAVLRRVNYFRQMAGVPAAVVFSEQSNHRAQAAALLMGVNNALNHNPPSSWVCYPQIGEEGAAGAGSANLAWGATGWEAISLYMEDPGGSNLALGHRRWILYPQTREMGTGDIPGRAGHPAINALVVFDDRMWGLRPPTREEFVAWPPPGYVPIPVVYPRWSFALAGADFSAAAVEMSAFGIAIPLKLAPLAEGYGENTLVWEPQGLKPGTLPADFPVTVAVRNVLVNGQPRNFTYQVILFNPTD